MKMTGYFLLLLVFGLSGRSDGQNLRVGYSPQWGISSISYGKQTLVDLNNNLGRGFGAEVFKLIQRDRKIVIGWSHLQSQNWNDTKKEYTAQFAWGSVICNYRQSADTLFIKINLTNKTKTDTLCGLSFCPFTMNVGKRPSNFQQYFPYYSNNISSPAVVRADLERYQIFVENPDADKKVYMGMLEESNSGGSVYKIWTGNIPYNGMNDFDPQVELRLAPGKSFSYSMVIKFCKPDAPLTAVSPKAYANFRNSSPFKIIWKDRRPIGELFLSSFTGKKINNNPRNWSVVDANQVNTTTVKGRALFKEKLFEYARQSIVNLKGMNAQGMITWDIEGQEFPHPLSYIGSPDIQSRMAPEMNNIADEYFNLFKKAGFKTGICIRPDSVVFTSDGKWIEHVSVKDPAATLIRKISYAHKRWGCSIFYIDSNIDPAGALMDYSVFKKVSEKFPDILLIPEHESILYYGYTAPYSDLRFENLFLGDDVKSVYPGAFKVIAVPDGLKETEQKNIQNLYNSIKQGNIFLFRAWFNDEPTNSLIKKAYKVYNDKLN